MPLDASILVTTIGGSTANSYVSLQEFIDYCDQRLSVDSFNDAEPDDKIRALLMAGKRLQRENWRGNRVDTTQVLAWPRIAVAKVDGAGIGSYSADYGYGGGIRPVYLPTEIPQQVKDAQSELALAYLGGFSEADGVIDSWQADDVRITYQNTRPPGLLPYVVLSLIAPLIGSSARLVRA